MEQTRCGLPVGTYVRVTERGPNARTYIGQVSGYDVFRSKYRIASRIGGWGEWRFVDVGAWAFPAWVEEISAKEAHRLPEVSAEEPHRMLED